MTPDQIRALCARVGGQERLAHIVGVSFATVSRWVNGHKKPSRLAEMRLAEIERKQTKPA
jgi:DNA-binding transcriptional regulator YdaS (Cro superfamily)